MSGSSHHQENFLADTSIHRDEATRHLDLLRGKPDTNFYENSAATLLDHTFRDDMAGYLARQKPWEAKGNPWLTNECRAPYLRQLRDIRQVLDLEQPVVYAPGHGNDVSHIEAFHDARAIYNLEVGPEHVHLLRSMYADEPRIQTTLGIVTEYTPPEKVDVLFMGSPGFKLDDWNFAVLLKEDAFVITNARIACNPLLHYMGSHRGGSFVAGSPKDIADRVVTTDAELLERSHAGSREATYASVLRVVYAVRGEAKELVATYTAIWNEAVEQEVIRQREFTLDPERIARVEALGMHYCKYDWTEADSEQVRKDCQQRTITLEHDGRNVSLKPLPKISHRARELDVYRFRG